MFSDFVLLIIGALLFATIAAYLTGLVPMYKPYTGSVIGCPMIGPG